MRVAKSDTKDALREAQWLYLDTVLRLDPKKRTLTEIARDGGMNPSTLTRFYNQKNHKGTLEALTIRRITEVTGIAPSASIAGGLQVAGTEEAEPYIATAGDARERMIKAAMGGRGAVDAWILRTSALTGAGYLPGDVVLLDMNATPKAGDAVRAQAHDTTVWRIFEPPYLVSASSDPGLRRPLLVDNSQVVIRGVVIAGLRLRPQAA